MRDVAILISQNIDINIRNRFGSTAADEARTPLISELILNSKEDRIMNYIINYIPKD